MNGAEWTNGVSNGALYFDGSDYVAVPDNPSLSGFTQLTLEAWIKPDRFDSYLKGIVNKGNGGGYFGDEYGLQLNNDKIRLILSAGSPTGWIVVADTDPVISLHQWYHVVGVWDSTHYYIYVNGRLAKSGQTIVSGAMTHDTSNSLNIGGINAGSWLFNGAIDEVKIYNYARTAEEIWNDYTSFSATISAQYSTFVSARNNYKKIFGQDVVIGQIVDRTLSGVINDLPAHYPWNSWAGQTYVGPPDGFSIRIETIQPDYVYKIIGLGYMGGGQPSASGWIKVNSPFVIEQINNAFNYSWPDGSNVRLFVNKETGDITFSAKWCNWPALVDATTFEFAITIAKPGGVLPPFSYDTTRGFASYAYDTDMRQVVMFGGRIWDAMSLQSDLWTFDPASSQWTSVTAVTGPSNRITASMSYNPVTRKLLVFGGCTDAGEASDTWAFQFTGANTGIWTQIAGTAPSPRSGAPMVFDSKNNLFVLFGGERYVYSLGDTWVFDPSSNTWINKNPSPSPSQRARAAMAYDAQSGKVLLFGGLDKGAGALLSDTWLYDAATNTWQQVSTATAPSARQWPSLTCDGNGVFYLFGGWRVDAGGGLGQYLDDTWKFDMATMQWTQLSPSASPPPQSQGALLYLGNSRFILINGWRDSPLGEVWYYDAGQNKWAMTISQPDFEISISREYAVADPHSTTEYTVNVTSLNGFNEQVSLSAVYSSHELSGSFDETVITPPAGDSVTTTLTVSVLSEAINTHQIYITGTSGTLSHTDTTSLHVPYMSVPYYFQGDTGWCVPTSVAMVLRYYGVNVHSWNVACALLLGNNGYGDPFKFVPYPGEISIVNTGLIELYLTELQLSFETDFNVTPERIKQMLSQGKPVIYQRTMKYPWEVPPFGAGHAMVITGFLRISETDYFFVNDPACSIQEKRSWFDLVGLELSWIIGVGGVPDPPEGVLNVGGGGGYLYRNTQWPEFSTLWAYSTSSSDSLRIYQSGFPTGLQWKQLGSHTKTLNPEDRFEIGRFTSNDPYYGQWAGIGNLIVNPTDLFRNYEFEVTLVDSGGRQRWSSGLVDVESAYPCNTTYPSYIFPKMRDTGVAYGRYQVILKLYSVAGLLVDNVEMPEIMYLPLKRIIVHSPANLLVTDPQGLSIGIAPDTGELVNEIPDAFYSGPGTEPQVVMIPDPLNGTYSIILVGTANGDYTLTIECVTADQTLTQTFKGAIIEQERQDFSLEISEAAITFYMNARIDIDPDTLNLGSKGNWITAYAELYEGVNVGSINVSSILLNNSIPVDPTGPVTIGDYDGDGILDLMVKFDRAQLAQYILDHASPTGQFTTVALTVTGELDDGTPFRGSDTITVVVPMQKGRQGVYPK